MENKFDGFTEAMFKYFFELGVNNTKTWFDAHRDEYMRDVRIPMRALAVVLGAKLYEIDQSIEIPGNPDKAIARINRDIRFSKDKTAYRTNLWITFKHTTPDWQTDPAFYFDIGFDRYSYGVGYYLFTPELRERMKRVIITRRDLFESAVRSLKGSVFTLGGDRYKRPIDKTLSELEREWCERKSLYIYVEREPEEILFSRALVDKVYGDFLAIKPVYDFFREIKGGGE